MVGSTQTNHKILVRDSTFVNHQDSAVSYEANFVIGAIVLAQPGELAELGFVETDYTKTANVPSIYVLIDEIDGALAAFGALASYVSEPPLLYGATGAPVSLYSNRYYFKQTVAGANPQPAYCRFLSVLIDYGTNSNANEILTMTLYGSIKVENG